MATLRVRGYLVNGSVFPDYEIFADDLIEKFIGDDTGAPLESAAFALVTDDGHTVAISVVPSIRGRHGEAGEPSVMRALVREAQDSP